MNLNEIAHDMREDQWKDKERGIFGKEYKIC